MCMRTYSVNSAGLTIQGLNYNLVPTYDMHIKCASKFDVQQFGPIYVCT